MAGLVRSTKQLSKHINSLHVAMTHTAYGREGGGVNANDYKNKPMHVMITHMAEGRDK